MLPTPPMVFSDVGNIAKTVNANAMATGKMAMSDAKAALSTFAARFGPGAVFGTNPTPFPSPRLPSAQLGRFRALGLQSLPMAEIARAAEQRRVAINSASENGRGSPTGRVAKGYVQLGPQTRDVEGLPIGARGEYR